MWLINASNFQLKEVWDERKEKYAILSHRWDIEEVSFRVMQNLEVATKLKGFAKIRKSCELALKEKYQYVWIDTCCINKESSADLSEAINSMYRWYQASAVCYAYLLDVQADGSGQILLEQQIKDSVWFTRGWTLQELLAPPNLRFYNQHWIALGTKQTLGTVLTQTTGIDDDILRGKDPLASRSIAQRMSWASKRRTTRKEDRAYCLLGIFDVNIPLLYGEGGKKAFLRLQEEIIRQSDDHTIFAWPIHRSDQPGLLADKPKAFRQCHSVRAVNTREGRTPYSMTNRGLSIKLPATPYTVDTYVVLLDCADGSLLSEGVPLENYRLGIFLRRLEEDDQFARVEQEGDTFVQLPASDWASGMSNPIYSGVLSRRLVEWMEINVRQHMNTSNTHEVDDSINGFRFATPEIFERTKTGADAFGIRASGSWDPRNHIMTVEPGYFGTAGTIDIARDSRRNLLNFIQLGFDFSFHPMCFVHDPADHSDIFEFKNMGQRRKWPADEYMQSLDPYERSLYDLMARSKVRNDEPAMELKIEPSLWAFKGDRIDGLDVQLGELGRLWITKGLFEGKKVWDVFVQMERP